MANNVPITTGSGAASVAAETVAGVSFQQIEVYGGGGASVLSVNPDGSFKASIIGVPTVSFSGSPSISGGVTIVGNSIPPGSVSGTVGASVIGTVPVTQSGVNITSIVSTVPSSVLVGASIFGALPGGNAIIGAVAASISGVVNTAGSVAGYMAPYATSVQGVTSVITGTSSVLVLPAPGGTSRNYLTHALVTNGAATATQVSLIDNGKVIWTGWAAASGGGWSENWTVPLPQPTSVLALYAVTSAQASVFVAVNGFTGV